MYCENCNTELTEKAKFCLNCGASQEEQEKSSSPKVEIDDEKTIRMDSFEFGQQKSISDDQTKIKSEPTVEKAIRTIELPSNQFFSKDNKPSEDQQCEPNQKSSAQNKTSRFVNNVPHNGRVSFGNAIRLFFLNYANFTGRASRSEFWWVFLLFELIMFLLSALVSTIIPIIGVLIPLALIIPSLSLWIRRLHDVGKSWVWLLMAFVPIYGVICLLVLASKESTGNNEWGKGPL